MKSVYLLWLFLQFVLPSQTLSFNVLSPSPANCYAAAVYGDSIYYGCITGKDIFKYHVDSDAWSLKATHPSLGTRFRTMPLLDGRLYLVGGIIHGTAPSVEIADLWAYNIVTDIWESKTEAPSAMSWTSSAIHNGILYTLDTSMFRSYTIDTDLSLCGDPMLTNLDGQQFKLPLQPDTVYTLLSSPSLSLTAMVEASPTLPPEDNVVVTHVGVRALVASESVWFVVDAARLLLLPSSRFPDSVASDSHYHYNDSLSVTKTDDGGALLTTAHYSVVLSPQLVSLMVTRNEAVDSVCAYPPSGWVDVRVVPHGCVECQGLLCHGFSNESLNDVDAYVVASGSLFGDVSVFF